MVECGLTNLATCIPQKIAEFFVNLLNGAIEPLLNLNHTLLTEPVATSIFYPIWAIIMYILSLFYGLFFLVAGFNFMISGYDVEKRERAKQWFWNILMMVLFVQASFLIYELLIEVGSLLTVGVIDIIDPDFFLMTADSIVNFGLQLVLLIPYIVVLVITLIFLALRYVLVAVGVVMFPLGIFFSFIPPMKSYGKLILGMLVGAIFLPFFNALILLGASMLAEVSVFASFKMVLLTVAYLGISLLMILMTVFGIVKSAMSVLNSDVGRSVTTAVKFLV